MSCHDIGRGMNSVVKKVIFLLDNNKISTESAREIIAACRIGVNWCDGNEDEAVECIRKSRCGWCLRKIERGNNLFSLWNLGLGESLFMDDDLLKCGDGTMLASDGLCEECFDYVVSSKCKEGISPAQIKEKIIDRSSLDNNLDVRNSKEL